MQMKRPIFFIALMPAVIGLFFFLAAPSAAYAAFGISPPFLNASHLVPGTTYTQVVYLVQDQPDQNLNIQANLSLGQPAASWVSIDKGFNFTIPAGTRQFPVTITITVPKNAALGIYSGTLSFNTAPSSAGQVTIALGVQVAINLTVGNDIFENYKVPLITFPDIEEGQSPVVQVKFQNDGNVPESFDGATYQLYDQYDAVQLAYIQESTGFPSTPPFTVKDYDITFPIGFYLGIGQYWGVVSFYKNGQVVASQKTVFNVLKAGLAAEIGRFIEDDWFTILIVILIAAALVTYAIIRRRRRNNI